MNLPLKLDLLRPDHVGCIGRCFVADVARGLDIHITRARLADPRAGAGADFARAMAAFDAGDYGRAEGAFLGFERRHPDDARCEDATFLRAVARARHGDTAGASAIAREYLERYPSGLRVREARQLITPSAELD